MSIPARLHFVWIGDRLPWFVKLAIQSALQRVPGARVTLWATHDLSGDPHVAALRDARFELTRLDEDALFRDAPAELPLELIARLYRELSQPAARANIARLLILLRFGGIYLDTDTLTVRDLRPLYELGGFCGLEHVVWPLARDAWSYRYLVGPAREVLRASCSFLPGGDRRFPHIAHLFPQAANNAVLGFHAGHPFLLDTLQRIDSLSQEDTKRRYRLGTYLLQEMLGRAPGVHQLGPDYFYPLGPEVSRQYFRKRRDVDEAVEALIRPDTHVLHWYASVSQLNSYDEARVRRERDQTLFARLAFEVLR